MSKATIIYAQQPIPNEISKSIFLAGPSLRPGQEGTSWRIKALEILELLEYDGVVFVPEAEVGNFEDFDYEKQIMWETKCLQMADNIVFFINRNIDSGLLGLTTNDEFGYWKASGKCILITELNADKVRYQEWWAKDLKMEVYHDLFNGLKNIINIQTDCRRRDGERNIPQEVWKMPQFEAWYKQLKSNGNWISDAKILNIYRTPKGAPFAFSMWANIYIKSENRYKNNEFIFSRPDISSCVLYYWRPNPMDCEIVLVSEFRTPVNNEMGKVYEIPGGSSVKPGLDPREIVIEELQEETGFSPDINRLDYEGDRQIYATLLTHKSHLYSYRLNKYELDQLKSNQNKVFGNEADSERTELHVMTVGEAIDKKYIDWNNMGQILCVINRHNDI
jgi:8-oxo-dGTP pyrophosphatase MutT (NUDIX family)